MYYLLLYRARARAHITFVLSTLDSLFFYIIFSSFFFFFYSFFCLLYLLPSHNYTSIAALTARHILLYYSPTIRAQLANYYCTQLQNNNCAAYIYYYFSSYYPLDRELMTSLSLVTYLHIFLQFLLSGSLLRRKTTLLFFFSINNIMYN